MLGPMELQETFFVLSVLLLSSVDAQEVTGRRLQPWLVGLTAVVGFLFIVFLLMLVNRIWCSKKRNDDDEFGNLEATRSPYEDLEMRTTSESQKEENGHTNKALEPDEPNKYTSL